MVKFKKLFSLKFVSFIFAFLVISFSLVTLVSCSNNEIDRVSKGLTTYEITAKLSEDMKILGTEKVIYKNNTGVSISELYFHLYPRAFRKDAIIKPYTSLTLASCFPNGQSYGDIEIKNVTVNEGKIEHIISGDDEDILNIPLNFSLENKKIVEVVIDFEITIPNCTHRFGYYNDNINLGNWYPIVCVFENGEFNKTPYYATGDPFYSDMANYFVNFTYPSDYSLFATGERIDFNEELKNETNNVTKLSAKAVRDFAINLSKNTQAVSGKIDNTTVTYVGYKSDENMQEYLNLSLKAYKFFSENFGKYPYSSLIVVKTPFIYGGMEYPNIVFISDSIDDEDEYKKVIVHEIPHQWWYGVVGNNEIKEAWLDESLTEYSTALFFENNTEFGIDYNELIDNAISSYTLYVDVIKSIRDSVNTKMTLPVNEYQNDYEYSYMIYVKGVIMFDELKNAVGEGKVVSGLKKYYNDNKFTNATKDDFYCAFKSACHKDLESFFEGYLSGTTVIANLS